MALSRTKTIVKIEALLSEMDKFIVMGKIRANYLNIHERSEELPAEIVRDAYQWLLAIYQGSYAQILTIWKLCSEEVWARYVSFGKDFDDHAEVILLRNHLSTFRAQMHSRPVFFMQRRINAILKRQNKN